MFPMVHWYPAASYVAMLVEAAQVIGFAKASGLAKQKITARSNSGFEDNLNSFLGLRFSWTV